MAIRCFAASPLALGGQDYPTYCNDTSEYAVTVSLSCSDSPLTTALDLPRSPSPIPNERKRGLLPRICKGYEGFAVVSHDGGGDGKIVGVSFVDVHGTGSKKVATLGPVSSLVPGGGRKTFVAACEHAEKLGFSTLVRAHRWEGRAWVGGRVTVETYGARASRVLGSIR